MNKSCKNWIFTLKSFWINLTGEQRRLGRTDDAKQTGLHHLKANLFKLTIVNRALSLNFFFKDKKLSFDICSSFFFLFQNTNEWRWATTLLQIHDKLSGICQDRGESEWNSLKVFNYLTWLYCMILKQSNVLLFLYHKYPTTGTLSVTQSLQLSISQKQVLLFTTYAWNPES